MKEIIGQTDLKTLSPEIQNNLSILLERINKVRTVYNKSMIVTSGLRTKEHHIEIYKNLAKQRKQIFDLKKVPMGSLHLKGAAVDISDKDGSLYKWCQENVSLLEQIGLWCEEKDDQARVHFQILPPKSGKRFFKP